MFLQIRRWIVGSWNIFEIKTGWQRSTRLYHAIDCQSRCHFHRRSGSFNRSATCGHLFLADRIPALRWRSWPRPVGTSLGRNLDILRSRGTTTPTYFRSPVCSPSMKSEDKQIIAVFTSELLCLGGKRRTLASNTRLPATNGILHCCSDQASRTTR